MVSVTPSGQVESLVLELLTFGRLELRRTTEGDPEPQCTQPKRLALLTYLAVATPRGFHRRDTLLALFWPESDDARARQALRQTVYLLRDELGKDIVVNRGEEEIGLNWEAVWCDAAAFHDAVSTGDFEQALELYQGDLLPGFHISDAPGFSRWLDDERARFRRGAAAAAWELAVGAGGSDDTASALRWARRAVAIEPQEEGRLRTVITRLDQSGDRAGAVGLFEDFSRRLSEEYQLEPAPETRDLVESVRARSQATQPATGQPGRPFTLASSEREVALSTTSRPSPRRTIVATVILVGLVLSLIAFGPLWWGEGTPGSGVPRVAVLPFENLGPAEDEWFAAGMTVEITSRLANVSGLAVIGPWSTIQYKGSSKSSGNIAVELDADYLLVGTVQRDQTDGAVGEVRITLQLIRALDEARVWARPFTMRMATGEIFRMQAEVASQVIQELGVTLQEHERGALEVLPTDDFEAYELFLRGRGFLTGALSESDLLVAVQRFEEAVEHDPGFAVAYAALAQAHVWLWWQNYDRSEQRLAWAKEALDRAFEFNAPLPEAQIALGYYYGWGLLDSGKALEAFTVAQASQPNNADISYGIGVTHRNQGNLEEALVHLRKAEELDPRSGLIVRDIAHTYVFMRESVEAKRFFRRAATLDPGWPTYLREAYQVHLRLEGNTANARNVLAEAQSLGLEHPFLLFLGAMIEISDGNYETALDRLTPLTVDALESVSFFVPKAQVLAEIHGLLGDEELQRAYFDSSRSFLEARVQRNQDDARLHSALGIAYAGLGQKAEAVREGQLAVDLRPITEHAWRGVYRVEDLAIIYTMVGEHDMAIDRLEYLLTVPGSLTTSLLQIDYRFNPLRDNPRFQALLDRYE